MVCSGHLSRFGPWSLFSGGSSGFRARLRQVQAGAAHCTSRGQRVVVGGTSGFRAARPVWVSGPCCATRGRPVSYVTASPRAWRSGVAAADPAPSSVLAGPGARPGAGPGTRAGTGSGASGDRSEVMQVLLVVVVLAAGNCQGQGRPGDPDVWSLPVGLKGRGIENMSLVLCLPFPVFYALSPIFCLPFSVFCLPSSVFRILSLVSCLPCSVFCL